MTDGTTQPGLPQETTNFLPQAITDSKKKAIRSSPVLSITRPYSMTFYKLLTQWNWKSIRNCLGRFLLVGARPDLPPEAVVGLQQSY